MPLQLALQCPEVSHPYIKIKAVHPFWAWFKCAPTWETDSWLCWGLQRRRHWCHLSGLSFQGSFLAHHQTTSARHHASLHHSLKTTNQEVLSQTFSVKHILTPCLGLFSQSIWKNGAVKTYHESLGTCSLSDSDTGSCPCSFRKFSATPGLSFVSWYFLLSLLHCQCPCLQTDKKLDIGLWVLIEEYESHFIF